MKSRINLKKKIFDIPDFPQKGIIFRDITPLLLDPISFNEAINQMLTKIKKYKIDKVMGIESRGYLFGPILANKLNAGFIPVRKINKLLPRETVEQTYALEYGTDGVKIHADSIRKGEKVIIVDDLIATGGTALATAKLAEKLGGNVIALVFLNELCFLNPRAKLSRYKIISLLKYR